MKKYIWEIKFEILGQIIFAALESLSMAGIAFIPKILVDSLSTEGSDKKILYMLVIYILLSLGVVIFSYFDMRINWKYAVKFENSIKKDYFNAVAQMDDVTFHQRKVSDYIAIQSNDIMQIEQDYLTPLISSINQIIKVLIFGIVLFWGVDWRIALIVFSSSIIASISPKFIGKISSSKRLAFVNQLGKYTNIIYDIFDGYREINSRTFKQIVTRHSRELDATTKSRYSYGKSKTASLSISAVSRTIVNILGFGTVIILLSNDEISIGTAVATFGFINSFVEPLEETLYCFTTMETVRDVKNKIFSMLKDTKVSKKIVKKEFKNNLIVENLCANNGSFKLKHISYCFESGENYAITGANGSGKSTLLKAIMTYIPLDSGRIIVDGVNLLDLDLSWLISYTPQKPHIFDSDYYDNITVFGSYSDQSKKLIEDISLPYETVCKIVNQKDNKKLSGGEKQIVQYIRARNSDAPVLILDEPFSAVDSNIKQLLMEDIGKLKDKTVIMITHDTDETLKYFDEVIELRNGLIEVCYQY